MSMINKNNLSKNVLTWRVRQFTLCVNALRSVVYSDFWRDKPFTGCIDKIQREFFSYLFWKIDLSVSLMQSVYQVYTQYCRKRKYSTKSTNLTAISWIYSRSYASVSRGQTLARTFGNFSSDTIRLSTVTKITTHYFIS